MSSSMLVKALGAVFAGALALTGCGIADAMNPSNVLSSDHHEASSAVERNGNSVSEAALNDDTNGFGYHIPSYCGKKSTYMLTGTGEVYQLFMPTTEHATDSTHGNLYVYVRDYSGNWYKQLMDFNSSGINSDVYLTESMRDYTSYGSPAPHTQTPGPSTAYCMIPLPYLPAGIKAQASRPVRQAYISAVQQKGQQPEHLDGNYDGLGATKSGSLFAVANQFADGMDSNNPNTAQVYYLSASERRKYAPQTNVPPNPRPDFDPTGHTTTQTEEISHWKKLNWIPLTIDQQNPTKNIAGNEYVSGGAVDPSGIYYLMAANMLASKQYIDFWKTDSATNPTKVIYAGRLNLNTPAGPNHTSMRPIDDDGDIEFDENGNLDIYLSWIDTASERRTIRRIVIPKSDLQKTNGHNNSFNVNSPTSYGADDSLVNTYNVSPGTSITRDPTNNNQQVIGRGWRHTNSANIDQQLEGVASDNIENSGNGIFAALGGANFFGSTPSCNLNDTRFSIDNNCPSDQIADISGDSYNSNSGQGQAGQRIYSLTDSYSTSNKYTGSGLKSAIHLPYRPPRILNNDNDDVLVDNTLWGYGSTDWADKSSEITYRYDMYNGTITDLAKAGYPEQPPTPPLPSILVIFRLSGRLTRVVSLFLMPSLPCGIR